MILRNWLLQNDMTIDHLAIKLDYNRSYVYGIIKGTFPITKKFLLSVRHFTQGKVMKKEEILANRRKYVMSDPKEKA